MRKPITVAQHGNSCRITMPPPILRYLKWLGGTELMMVVRDKHHLEIVDLDTYIQEQGDLKRAEQRAQAETSAP